jgi:diadenosine tetraphosphate (Ap4A) HIT family hydrolase
MREDCFTCAVNAGRIEPPGGVIYQDESWVAEHGVDRLVRGYVVLKPKRHVHEAADLLPEEATALGPALSTLLAAMRTALEPERIYVCSFAETVHHLHFHLIPRYADMPGLGPNLVPALFEERWGCTPEEAEVASAGIRTALERGRPSDAP